YLSLFKISINVENESFLLWLEKYGKHLSSVIIFDKSSELLRYIYKYCPYLKTIEFEKGYRLSVISDVASFPLFPSTLQQLILYDIPVLKSSQIIQLAIDSKLVLLQHFKLSTPLAQLSKN